MIMTKVAPVASVRLPSLTGITQPPLPTDSADLRYPSAALISSSQSSSSSKKRSRGQMELGSANEALRRRKATLFAAVVARRLNARRPLSLNEEVGEEYMRRLRALFHACDADEDNAVTPNELLVLMRIMGATSAEVQAIGTTASGKLNRGEVVTFDAFLEMCRSLIIRCTQEQRPLPPPSFVARCKPLKNAYNRCDTDGSHDISRTELEIALQKLGLMLSDEELDAIQERLDPNNDGCIEWSDFLCAAWQDSLGGLESSSSALHKYFSVDLFIELPSFIHASADRRQQPTRKRLRRGAVSGDEIPRSYLSRMERMGVEFLTRVSKERLKRVKRATLAVSLSARFGMRARIAQLQPINQQEIVVPIVEPTKSRFNFLGGLELQKKEIIPEQIYGFPVEIMRHIRNIEWTGSLLGCLIGLVTGLISMGLESLLPPELTGDDVLGLCGLQYKGKQIELCWLSQSSKYCLALLLGHVYELVQLLEYAF